MPIPIFIFFLPWASGFSGARSRANAKVCSISLRDFFSFLLIYSCLASTDNQFSLTVALTQAHSSTNRLILHSALLCFHICSDLLTPTLLETGDSSSDHYESKQLETALSYLDMAVLPDFPGVKVEITVRKIPLDEYATRNDIEVDTASNGQMTKRIIPVENEEFCVVIVFSPGFQPLPNPCPGAKIFITTTPDCDKTHDAQTSILISRIMAKVDKGQNYKHLMPTIRRRNKFRQWGFRRRLFQRLDFCTCYLPHWF